MSLAETMLKKETKIQKFNIFVSWLKFALSTIYNTFNMTLSGNLLDEIIFLKNKVISCFRLFPYLVVFLFFFFFFFFFFFYLYVRLHTEQYVVNKKYI